MKSPQISTTSSVRIFPATSIDGPPTTLILSIVDASVARFAPTAAVWFHTLDPAFPEIPISESLLLTALRKTLDTYRPWTGQLDWVPGVANGRIQVTYKGPSDPGVEFVTAQSHLALETLFPPSPTDKKVPSIFDASNPSLGVLVPKTPKLALENITAPTDGLPGMVIQVTTFSCGAVAISAKLAHPLADAVTLVAFMKWWAWNYNQQLGNAQSRDQNSDSESLKLPEPSPPLNPVFSPSLLDSQLITPSVNAASTPSRLSGLMHNISWLSPLPKAWNPSLPVRRLTLRLPSTILSSVTSPILERAKRSTLHTSTLDALLTFLWSHINLARFPSNSSDPAASTNDISVHLSTTLTLRSAPRRLNSPALPANFAGSPIILCRTTTSLFSAISDPAATASKLRETLKAFEDPGEIRKLLGEWDASEGRVSDTWHAFIGRRDGLVTSWVGAGELGKDLVFRGGKLRECHPVMPMCDGVIVVMDGDPDGSSGGGRWAKGARVEVYLEESAARRFIDGIEKELGGDDACGSR